MDCDWNEIEMNLPIKIEITASLQKKSFLFCSIQKYSTKKIPATKLFYQSVQYTYKTVNYNLKIIKE